MCNKLWVKVFQRLNLLNKILQKIKSCSLSPLVLVSGSGLHKWRWQKQTNVSHSNQCKWWLEPDWGRSLSHFWMRKLKQSNIRALVALLSDDGLLWRESIRQDLTHSGCSSSQFFGCRKQNTLEDMVHKNTQPCLKQRMSSTSMQDQWLSSLWGLSKDEQEIVGNIEVNTAGREIQSYPSVSCWQSCVCSAGGSPGMD